MLSSIDKKNSSFCVHSLITAVFAIFYSWQPQCTHLHIHSEHEWQFESTQIIFWKSFVQASHMLPKCCVSFYHFWNVNKFWTHLASHVSWTHHMHWRACVITLGAVPADKLASTNTSLFWNDCTHFLCRWATHADVHPLTYPLRLGTTVQANSSHAFLCAFTQISSVLRVFKLLKTTQNVNAIIVKLTQHHCDTKMLNVLPWHATKISITSAICSDVFKNNTGAANDQWLVNKSCFQIATRKRNCIHVSDHMSMHGHNIWSADLANRWFGKTTNTKC